MTGKRTSVRFSGMFVTFPDIGPLRIGGARTSRERGAAPLVLRVQPVVQLDHQDVFGTRAEQVAEAVADPDRSVDTLVIAGL